MLFGDFVGFIVLSGQLIFKSISFQIVPPGDHQKNIISNNS